MTNNIQKQNNINTINKMTNLTTQNTKNICPICGYDNLYEPAYDEYNCSSFEICPCCDTEFGFNDQWLFIKEECWIELRKMWIEKGAKWFHDNEYISQPENYNPITQLLNIGYIVSDSEKLLIENRSKETENDK